jgi:hypothetical protein
MSDNPKGKSGEKTGKRSKKTGKKTKLLRVLLVLFFIFIVLPLVVELVFFLMRIAPGAVIPDTFFVYSKISHPKNTSAKILEHESLPEILTNPDLASLSPFLSGVRSSGILEKPLVKLALRGSISAALFKTTKIEAPDAETEETPKDTYSYIAAWDSALLAPLLRILPLVTKFYKIPDLYYVQGGNSRFEYRGEDSTLYLGVKRNLLIVSNSEEIFSHALSPEGSSYASEKKATLKKQDISLLLASKITSFILLSLR